MARRQWVAERGRFARLMIRATGTAALPASLGGVQNPQGTWQIGNGEWEKALIPIFLILSAEKDRRIFLTFNFPLSPCCKPISRCPAKCPKRDGMRRGFPMVLPVVRRRFRHARKGTGPPKRDRIAFGDPDQSQSYAIGDPSMRGSQCPTHQSKLQPGRLLNPVRSLPPSGSRSPD